MLDSFPNRIRCARSLAVAIWFLATLLFGCQRVGTSRIPARGRYPLAHSSWGQPVRDSARADLQDRGLRLEFAARPREVFRDLAAETLARPTSRGLLTLGEIAYRIGRRSTSIAARESLEWYRDAAAYASLVVADSALGPEAISLHNRAVAQCLRQARGNISRDADTVRERLAGAGISLETADPDLDPRAFSRLDVAADHAVHGLARHDVEGLGVPLLAVRELPDRGLRTGQERFYGDRLVPPLTAVVLPGDSLMGSGSRNGPTRLIVFDPISHPSLAVGGRNVPLAADFTTPLAYQAEAMRGSALEIAGAINPERLSERTGVYLIHPYRPGKFPVLFIHGLVSSPGTWVPMFSELRADPVLREHYQFWFAYYPSGFPTPVSVAKLRKELHDLQQTLDPNGTDPALRNMVVVGHSMGGLISRMLIQSSGDDVWNAFFTRPHGQVVMNAEAREWVDGIFYFQPEPTIRRVVFMATPHRGANLANRVIGRVASALVRRSPRIRAMREAIEDDNGIEVFQPEYRRRMLSSIDNLEWDSPVLKTLARLPLAPGVPYHTVLGNISRREDLDRWTDGVVSYESAHFDGAESEVVVPYRHSSCTSKPEPITEVRRILRLHLSMTVD